MPELICFDAALGVEGLELLGETLRADCAAVATVFVLAEALIEAEDAIVEDTTAGCAAVATAAYVFFEASDVAVAAAFSCIRFLSIARTLFWISSAVIASPAQCF